MIRMILTLKIFFSIAVAGVVTAEEASFAEKMISSMSETEVRELLEVFIQEDVARQEQKIIANYVVESTLEELIDLIDRGDVSPNYQFYGLKGTTSLIEFSVLWGRDRLVSYLLNNQKIEPDDMFKALESACMNGDKSLVKLFFENSLNSYSTREDVFRSCALSAIERGHVVLLKYFFEENSGVDLSSSLPKFYEVLNKNNQLNKELTRLVEGLGK